MGWANWIIFLLTFYRQVYNRYRYVYTCCSLPVLGMRWPCPSQYHKCFHTINRFYRGCSQIVTVSIGEIRVYKMSHKSHLWLYQLTITCEENQLRCQCICWLATMTIILYDITSQVGKWAPNPCKTRYFDYMIVISRELFVMTFSLAFALTTKAWIIRPSGWTSPTSSLLWRN